MDNVKSVEYWKARLSNYEGLATPVKRKPWLRQMLCWHKFECVRWAWFRCIRCGREEGV